jgi:hypothetical protein
MSWNMEHRHLESPHPSHSSFFDQPIGGYGLEIDVEPMFLKIRTVPDHHGRVGMKAHPTAMPTLDFRRIHHVVEMPVREQKPVDSVARKKVIRSLGGIKKQVPGRGF